MTYRIEPLTPSLAEVFSEYLKNLSFDHAPHWATCFCRFYHHDCSYDEWFARTGEQNRVEAMEEIKVGNMKGYLAFDGDRCIGWLNANDSRSYIRLAEDVAPFVGERKVGMVICYVIDPMYRRQGVARLLLGRAIEDFRIQGCDGVLALPVDEEENLDTRYRGTLNMYNEAGFKRVLKEDRVNVMWLEF